MGHSDTDSTGRISRALFEPIRARVNDSYGGLSAVQKATSVAFLVSTLLLAGLFLLVPASLRPGWAERASAILGGFINAVVLLLGAIGTAVGTTVRGLGDLLGASGPSIDGPSGPISEVVTEPLVQVAPLVVGVTVVLVLSAGLYRYTSLPERLITRAERNR